MFLFQWEIQIHQVASHSTGQSFFENGKIFKRIVFWEREKCLFHRCFDSLDPDVLYICYRSKHCIYRYELSTGNYELYAGAREDPGYEDGKRLNARFNFPSQICFDLDGIMYIADSSNHCIRSIDREGAVSTVIGVPGRAGYVDGTPDDALFDEPWGVAVDEEGTIYIADTKNKCIRKLAIQ